MKLNYKILSMSSVRQSVKWELKQMNRGFYGAGYPHPGIECFIAQLGKLLTHYGSHFGIGIHMQALMELLITEAGISTQPLAEEYRIYSKWVTHCWLKSLWEKIDIFNFRVEIQEANLSFPWERDKWLIQKFEWVGIRDGKLLRLNRVRCHQQAVFFLDIIDAIGMAINRGKAWSTMIFLQELPLVKDFRFWAEAIHHIAQGGRSRHRLSSFITSVHKIWEWTYDVEGESLYHHKGATMDTYIPSHPWGNTQQVNRQMLYHIEEAKQELQEICTVREEGQGVIVILSSMEGPRPMVKPTNFWEVLEKLKRTCMWDNLK
jgi:hypothetical protein